MKFHPFAVFCISIVTTEITGFTTLPNRQNIPVLSSNDKGIVLQSTEQATSSSDKELQLPPELQRITDAFALVDDDSLRHKQLLYMANQLPTVRKDQMIPENKVPGCLSTVFVDGSARWCDEKDDYVIDYVGESDGLLTKGLVALLVR